MSFTFGFTEHRAEGLSELCLPKRSHSAWRLSLTPIFLPDDHYISVNTAISTFLSLDTGSTSLRASSGNTPSPASPGPIPSESNLFSVHTIHTSYDRSLPFNTHFSARHDQQENTEWTASERRKAQQGITVGNVEELDALVAILIPSCISYC